MALPKSLTGSSSSTAALNTMVRAQVTDPAQCELGGSDNDPFTNGFRMTRFLVGMSQATSCFADFLVYAITTVGAPHVNKGIVATGNAAGTDEPTHFEIIETNGGKKVQVWLYDDGKGVTPHLYFTWNTTDGSDVNGRLVIKGDATDLKEPEAVRVDFVRSDTGATNTMLFRFPVDSPDLLEGFQVVVTQTGTGADATYEAKGFLQTTGQWSSNLPTTETFDPPTLAAVAVADSTGLGAAIANFQNIGFDLTIPDDAGNPWVGLGSYQVTMTDKSYFDATGAEEWLWKGPTDARYVNTSATNGRFGGATLNLFLYCLEGAPNDPNCGTPPNNVPGLSLGSGYFTNTCTDANAADCTAMWSGIYTLGGGWGVNTPNSTTAEPSGDFRKAALGAAKQLTSTLPAGETAATAFEIPAAQ